MLTKFLERFLFTWTNKYLHTHSMLPVHTYITSLFLWINAIKQSWKRQWVKRTEKGNGFFMAVGNTVASLMTSLVAHACRTGDRGSVPRSGRSSGEGNGNPLQYSCLDNPMDRGAWKATVHWGRKQLDMNGQPTLEAVRSGS